MTQYMHRLSFYSISTHFFLRFDVGQCSLLSICTLDVCVCMYVCMCLRKMEEVGRKLYIQPFVHVSIFFIVRINKQTIKQFNLTNDVEQ